MGWADAFKMPAQPAAGQITAGGGTPPTTMPVGPRPVANDSALAGGVTPNQPPLGGGQMDLKQIEALAAQYMAGKPSGPATMQGLKQFLESHGVTGIEIPTHAGGSQMSGDKLAIGGAVYDFLGDEGGANRFQMSQDGYWVNGQPSSRPDRVEQAPEGFSLQGRNGLASFDAPGLLAPWTQEFQKPDPNNMMASPSYQWTLGRGLDALDKAAAARGTFNTGGAQKDAAEFAAGLASQEYDKDWNRNLNLYGINRDTFWGNQSNAFNRLNSTTQQGITSASNYADNVAGTYENMANANAAEKNVTGNNNAAVTGSAVNTSLGALFDYLKNRSRGGG